MLTDDADARTHIFAEIERRKSIWAKLGRMASDAVKSVQGQAERRGVEGTKWIDDGLSGNSSIVIFKGKAGKDKELCVFVSANGSIRWNKKEQNDNLIYEGYPNLSDSAPRVFKKAVVKVLMANLTQYCKAQTAEKAKKR